MGDEIELCVFGNKALAFFIIFNACLSLPNVRPLEFIEIVISIARISKLDAWFDALDLWKERFVAVSVTLHSTWLRQKFVMLTFYCIRVSRTCRLDWRGHTRVRRAWRSRLWSGEFSTRNWSYSQWAPSPLRTTASRCRGSASETCGMKALVNGCLGLHICRPT